MPYITSTMSAGVTYAIYKKTPGGLNIIDREISINGGANVINKALVTPQGVVTKVSDEELELLKQNPVFKTHVDGGYIKITKTEKKENTKDMTEKDKSAQPTEKDFTDQGKKAPKVNKKG